MSGGKGESEGTEKGKEEKREKDQGQWKVESGEGERGGGKQASKDREHKVCAGNAERKQRCQMRDEERRAALHISRVTQSQRADRHAEGQ